MTVVWRGRLGDAAVVDSAPVSAGLARFGARMRHSSLVVAEPLIMLWSSTATAGRHGRRCLDDGLRPCRKLGQVRVGNPAGCWLSWLPFLPLLLHLLRDADEARREARQTRGIRQAAPP